jgi:hypothetical protein
MMPERNIAQQGQIRWHRAISEALQIIEYRWNPNAAMARPIAEHGGPHYQRNQWTVAFASQLAAKPKPRHRVSPP